MNLANIIKKNGGVTLNTDGTEFNSNKGYMVSIKGSEIIVPADTTDEVLKKQFSTLLRQARPIHKIGYWLDEDKIYIDLSIQVNDLDEAMMLAKYHDQLAIFDLANQESIRVK